MLLVFLILIIVTVCVTIVGTYFLLNAENYHWQWTSFFSAASTAVYVYFYSIYYYYVKTKMSGFFQTSFYFGYTLMFCLGLGILCGEFYDAFSCTLKVATSTLEHEEGIVSLISICDQMSRWSSESQISCSVLISVYFCSCSFSYDIKFELCRSCWLPGFQFVCTEDLQEHQM